MLSYHSMNDCIIVDEVLLLICRSCALPSRLISVRLEESSMTTCSPVWVCQSSGNAASRGTTRTRLVTLHRVNILINRLRNANDGCSLSWICFRSACASAETCCCSTGNAFFRMPWCVASLVITCMADRPIRLLHCLSRNGWVETGCIEDNRPAVHLDVSLSHTRREAELWLPLKWNILPAVFPLLTHSLRWRFPLT